VNTAKVLVIDDDESIAQLVQATLASAGIDSDAARTAEDGIAMMRAHLYRVVALDVHMPGISGIETIAHLKRISPLVQVIMLTSDSSFRNVVECVGRGAVDFFAKDAKQLPLMAESVSVALARGARWASWLGIHSGWDLIADPQATL
jgi:DNA-binding NtrC family response regulator